MSGSRRSEEIEAAIAQTRTGLGDTLEAIEDRLAPRQFLEKGLDMIRNGGDMGRIGQILKDNPVPLALIGAGLGWLMLSQTGAARQIGSAAADAAGAVGDRVRDLVGRGEGDYAHAWTKREDAARRAPADMPQGSSHSHSGSESAIASRAYGAMTDAAGRVGDYGRQALDRAGDYAGGAGRQLGDVRDRFGQLMDEHPLAVGALGFLAGAVVAAALPSTRWEDEQFGETRDEVWREAQAAGQEMADKAREVASTAASAASEAAREAVSETAEAVKEEAERQGLTAGEEQKG